jgi:ribosomal protein S18 acetylase RimI-like enzyme
VTNLARGGDPATFDGIRTSRRSSVAVRVATADSVDELARVAARTFPLACPPSATHANIASFIDANLSVARFAEYLADPECVVLIAEHCERIVGYGMLVRGIADDSDVRKAVNVAPAVELSKMYVLPGNHGTGVATALMNAALAAAVELGGNRVWLGVNQENRRAQRFYAKHGFTVNGTRTFQLGAQREHDYVMVSDGLAALGAGNPDERHVTSRQGGACGHGGDMLQSCSCP